MIDWEQSYVGDAMQELGAVADELDFEYCDLPMLLHKYGQADEQSLARLRGYFAMRIARRLVQAFVGMPWNAHRDRSDVIDAASARLQRTQRAWSTQLPQAGARRHTTEDALVCNQV